MLSVFWYSITNLIGICNILLQFVNTLDEKLYKLLLVSILASSAVWVATSVHRQPFVPLHLCIDSHLCRCIVQRLCVAVFMHPCITTLGDRYRASLHVYERSVGFASCLVSRLGCHIVWQLSAAAFKHPCLKLWAFIL